LLENISTPIQVTRQSSSKNILQTAHLGALNSCLSWLCPWTLTTPSYCSHVIVLDW